MKKNFVLLVIYLITSQISYSQVIPNSKIDSILNLVSVQSISRFDKELSGDTLVTIGGISQILFSRYYQSIGNVRASQYLFEKFQSFGLNAKYMYNNATNVDVYAVKTGTKYPGRKFIIGAHYDDITVPFPGNNDTIHGADDNASGVCAVLESARLLANMNLDYTVIFIAFDEEEMGLFGSKGFADSCYFRGDTIMGVINLDMIGWDSNNDMKTAVMTDANSNVLYDDFFACNQQYQTGLTVYKDINGGGSDHQSFWARGYKAITPIEDLNDFNQYYHNVGDMFNKFNVPYFYKVVKASIATLLTWALDSRMSIDHIPLSSSLDTSSRLASAIIHFPIKIGTGTNAPRLYYKVGNGQYNFINAFEINQENYRFMIPGRPAGSKISYYIAAQDSAGNYVLTLPSGGSGINPPGTIPPSNPYIYYVLTQTSFCSNTTPKPIIDLQLITDTIHITQTGVLSNIKVSLNINHTNDGDIVVMLNSPNSSTVLTQFNGQNGQNYTGTIFDESAPLSITQGTPPFTGSFRPQNTFSNFYNSQMTGDWILKIFDNKVGDQGTLLNWCLQLQYSNPILVKENNQEIKDFKLEQNYPNPFNPNTVIGYSLQVNGYVTLKVFDVLGREIETLVNEYQKAGTYKINFPNNKYTINQLPGGVYFYKLQCDEFTQVKRMVLLK